MNLKQLEQKRDAFTTRIFWLMFEMVFIFGIPAVAAIFIGKKINNLENTINWIIVFLFVAFFLSWLIVGIRYQKVTAQMKELDLQIKEARKAENVVKE